MFPKTNIRKAVQNILNYILKSLIIRHTFHLKENPGFWSPRLASVGNFTVMIHVMCREMKLD